MSILGTIIYVIIGILVALFIGWLFAKWKIRRMIMKIDKEVNLPEHMEKINEQIMDQKLTAMKKEVRENERRRREFRGYGDRRLIPIDFGAGEPKPEESGKYPSSQTGDDRRSKLQDENTSISGDDNVGDGKTAGDSEEDWPDFS